MIRQLARIVKVDAISPILKADAIETATVGGWPVVTKKGEFSPGDKAVYFEIDSFLPEGNPAWQFLVDKVPFEFEGKRGHVLRTMTLRGQLSQGLLLKLDVLKGIYTDVEHIEVGTEVTEALGISKYEEPIPENLIGKIRGYFPRAIHKTDQERIQNLAEELLEWQKQGSAVSWEVTEKLEGYSCTFAWLENELHVCSRTVDWLDVDDNVFWKVANGLDIAEKVRRVFGTRNIAIQGELVGPGIEGNIYRLNEHRFYLYEIYDADEARYFDPDERAAFARELSLTLVPVVNHNFVIDSDVTMQVLLTMADGASALRPEQAREGLVFKARKQQTSFKAVSNKYLLKQK